MRGPHFGSGSLDVRGNDCLNEWCSPEELRHEMQHMREAIETHTRRCSFEHRAEAYQEEGVQIHVLDVVPLSFLQASRVRVDKRSPSKTEPRTTAQRGTRMNFIESRKPVSLRGKDCRLRSPNRWQHGTRG